MKQISIRIPESLLNQIDSLAKKEGRSRSNMICKILEKEFEIDICATEVLELMKEKCRETHELKRCETCGHSNFMPKAEHVQEDITFPENPKYIPNGNPLKNSLEGKRSIETEIGENPYACKRCQSMLVAGKCNNCK